MPTALFVWIEIGLIGFFTALAFTGFMARAGLGDTAVERSSHSGVVPTGGGVGIIAGLGVALCAASVILPPGTISPRLAPLLSLIFGVGLLGLCDDIYGLGAWFKFAILAAICVGAVWVLGPPRALPGLSLAGYGGEIALSYEVGFAGAVLWLFVVTNIVNFMDGANGMIGLSLLIANIGLFGLAAGAGAPATLVLSGLLAATLAGFLPYNFRRQAHVFCGDVGALTLGFGFAVAVLLLQSESGVAGLVLAAPVLILPFLADSLLTMARRAKRRENILRAHNGHIYQRLIRSGWSHLNVSWLYGIAALICANTAMIGVPLGWFERPSVLLLGIGGFALIFLVASNRLPD